MGASINGGLSNVISPIFITLCFWFIFLVLKNIPIFENAKISIYDLWYHTNA
jgi:hypothetical protein